MDDLTFLEQLGGADQGAANATLNVVLPDGHICHISDRICPYRLLDNCPLLYHGFEFGYQSRLQANIQASSRPAVIGLLRYCYTGSYLPCGVEDTLLFLPHAETYKIAEDFDVPELQLLAHANFSCQVEWACSFPTPPQDLLETIRFVYRYYSSQLYRQQQQGLLDTLLNYCICVFQYHKLSESPNFLAVVQEIPEFRQDLCRTNMQRNFQDDCAFDIIGLASNTSRPQPNVRPTTLASRDLPQAMLYDTTTPPCTTVFDNMHNTANVFKDGCSSDSDTTDNAPEVSSPIASALSTLVFRPTESQPVVATAFETDSSSEEEGFSLVHRPRPVACVTPNDFMSSPEVLPSNLSDVLALNNCHYSSEDDWTML